MPDQFAGRAIDIDAFQGVEFSPREVEDIRAAHHRNVDSFAIENITFQDRPPIEVRVDITPPLRTSKNHPEDYPDPLWAQASASPMPPSEWLQER